jgi:hypothetical protein
MGYARRAMFVIDENVSELEVLRLRKAGIRVRLIGDEVARIGDADENLLPILLRLKKPVLFSQDKDFFQLKWLHEDYALVWLDVHPNVVAGYVQQFLRHPEFDTQPNAWELWRALVRAGIDIGAEGIASCGKPSGSPNLLDARNRH